MPPRRPRSIPPKVSMENCLVHQKVGKVHDESKQVTNPNGRIRWRGYVRLELACGHQAHVRYRDWRRRLAKDVFPCVVCHSARGPL